MKLECNIINITSNLKLQNDEFLSFDPCIVVNFLISINVKLKLSFRFSTIFLNIAFCYINKDNYGNEKDRSAS